MKCSEEVSKMCMQAIKYKKYAEVRDCEKCCLYCKSKCDHACDKALEGESMKGLQVDYTPDEKKIKINLPEEVWENIDTIIMTRLFQEELVVEKQKESEAEYNA